MSELSCRAARLHRLAGSITVLLALTVSCTEEAFLNLTTALGTGQVNSRGVVTVQFVNNTPFRAIFTVATFSFLDQFAAPNDVVQFADGQDDTRLLEGNSVEGPDTFTCDRVLSIGGARMIHQIRATDSDEGLDEDALRPGVGFSNAVIGDPLATLPTEGTAEPLDILQGAEFPCEAQIIITFEQDSASPGGFRIDRQVILPP